MATRAPEAARSYYAESALAAQYAAQQARQAQSRGVGAVAQTIAKFQVQQAEAASTAVVDILAEQNIAVEADALLNSAAFTTELRRLEQMLAETTSEGLERLAESVVQDAGRAAESVETAVRRDVYHVRYVSLPCCARCAVLAGRVYRWSTGFQRHPNCDCTMIPTTVASPLRQNPSYLVRDGHVKGLSQADRQAIDDGADVARVVNVRRRSAGLSESGRVLAREGRLTPEGIYRRSAGNRDRAVALLKRYGYVS